MKKKIAMILACMITLWGATALAGDEPMTTPDVGQNANNVLLTIGEIKEGGDKRIRVMGEGSYKEIVLNIQDNTYIVSAEDGVPISFQDLKTGEKIAAYYSPGVSKSIPPQGNAIALVIGVPKTGTAGMYMKVAKVEKNAEGTLKAFDTNCDRIVTIKPEALAQTGDIAGIRDGSELIVWYDIMTLSIPAQATARKAVLLTTSQEARSIGGKL